MKQIRIKGCVDGMITFGKKGKRNKSAKNALEDFSVWDWDIVQLVVVKQITVREEDALIVDVLVK